MQERLNDLKNSLTKSVNNIVSVNKKNTAFEKANIPEKEELKNLEAEKEFYFDGVYCKSLTSFLSSLNYKNIDRQKEICSMSA